MSSPSYNDVFLAGVSPTVRASWEKAASLDEELRAVIHEAEVATPGLSVEPARFVSHIAERVASPPYADEHPSLRRLLRTSDLYLACACAAGSPPAIERFEARYKNVIDAVAAQLRLSHDELDELKQMLRIQLFVAAGSSRPKILEYSGTGELASWLRVFSLRLALKLRRKGAASPTEEDRLLELSSTEMGPELAYLKGAANAAFIDAFREALDSLDARDRTILRQHYVDRLSIDDLGALYGVHRTSTARWLRAVRTQLMRRTKSALMNRAGIDRSECESLIRLARSQFELTLRSLFAR